MVNSAPILAEREDFSLVLGGPLYQLWRRLHASGPALELLLRRLIGIPLIAWLPLLVLTVYEGLAVGQAVAVPFLYDFDPHARFLVAVPLLLLAEVTVHHRMRPLIQHFVEAGIVTPDTLPGFRAATDRALRLRNSVVAEVILAVLVFGVGRTLWQGGMSLDIPTWYASSAEAGRHLTSAGQWYVHVSVPIFQFLLLRWYFRLFIWLLLLWRVSRLDLRLTPTHPDRAGGLGFLSEAPIAFALVMLAQGVQIAAVIANRIFFQDATLPAFKYEIAAFVVLQLAVLLGPLFVFAPRLMVLKRAGRREYDALAARYTREFHDKWIENAAPAGESLLGSADIQSLADLANSYEVVEGMRTAPVERETLIQVAVVAVLPFLPLVLTVVPAEEILKKLVGMLL